MSHTIHSCRVQPSKKQNVSEEFCKYFKSQKYLYWNSSFTVCSELDTQRTERRGESGYNFHVEWKVFRLTRQEKKIVGSLLFCCCSSPFTVCESTARASTFSQFSDIVLNRLVSKKKHNSQPDVRKAVWCESSNGNDGIRLLLFSFSYFMKSHFACCGRWWEIIKWILSMSSWIKLQNISKNWNCP